MMKRQELMSTSKPSPCFKPELRAKILDGSKTQTRRIVKPQPPSNVTHAAYLVRSDNHPTQPHWQAHWMNGPGDIDLDEFVGDWFGAPHGQPGTTWYIREPLHLDDPPDGYGEMGYVAAYADDKLIAWHDGLPVEWRWRRSNLPQIHLPRQLARYFVRVTDVRVERLQAISEADAIAEGFPPEPNTCRCDPADVIDFVRSCGTCGLRFDDVQGEFYRKWLEIHGKESWEANPWVFVYAFERVEVERG